VSAETAVSIVIPAYDRAEFLRAAAESVLEQDHERLELIIVDDGSTDGTPELVAALEGEWAARPGRLRTTRHGNIGQARSTNRGWQLAGGELLGYLSSDDTLLPGAIPALVAALAERPEAVAAYADFELIDEAGGAVDRFRLEQFTVRDALLAHDPIVGPGAIFRRELLDRIDGMDPGFPTNVDFEFWLRVGLEGPLAHVPEVLAGYRVHEGMTSTDARGPEMAARAVALLDHFYALPGLSTELGEVRDRAYRAAYLAGALVASGTPMESDGRFYLADRRARRVSNRHAERDAEAEVAELRAELAKLAEQTAAGRAARREALAECEERIAALSARLEAKQQELIALEQRLANVAYESASLPRRLARRARAVLNRREAQRGGVR